MNYIAEPMQQCIKVKKWMDTVQQFSERNSLFVNKEIVLYLESAQVLKNSKHFLIFVVLYPKRRDINAEVCRN